MPTSIFLVDLVFGSGPRVHRKKEEERVELVRYIPCFVQVSCETVRWTTDENAKGRERGEGGGEKVRTREQRTRDVNNSRCFVGQGVGAEFTTKLDAPRPR